MLEQEPTGVPDSTVPIWLFIHYPPNKAKAAAPSHSPPPSALGSFQASGRPLATSSLSQSWFLHSISDPYVPLLVSPDPAWTHRRRPPPPGMPPLVSPGSPTHAHGEPFPATLPHGAPHTWLVTSPGGGSMSCGGCGAGVRCVPGVSGSPLDLAAAVLFFRRPALRDITSLNLGPSLGLSGGRWWRTRRPPSSETRRLLGPASRGGAA